MRYDTINWQNNINVTINATIYMKGSVRKLNFFLIATEHKLYTDFNKESTYMNYVCFGNDSPTSKLLAMTVLHCMLDVHDLIK